MSSKTNEVNTYFGRCRCCLDYGYWKNMWEEYYWKGEKEIYVQMLMHCFSVSWEPQDLSKEQDQICESCVLKLREANQFKKTVLDSQLKLMEHLEDAPSTLIKTEQVILTDYKEEPDGINLVDNSLDEPYSTCDNPDDPDYVDDSQDMDYEEVEFLEEEEEKEIERKPKLVQRRTKGTIPPSNTKWPKKLPKSERYKTYKQYPAEDLRACLEAIRNEGITITEASERFNIPRKTLSAKIKEPIIQSEDSKEIERQKKYQFIQEIKIILTYTNVTPFRSKSNRYACIYCPGIDQYYEDPDELRNHSKSEHINDRIEKIEYVLRPYWSNEIIKLDIHNLQCIICNEHIETWNDMFKHVQEVHEVVFELAYTKAIPYNLSEKLTCVLCKQSFDFYMHLDTHMNAHYNNHVCSDCGDTFLTEVRLKQHVKKHDIGHYPCAFCNKVFTVYKSKVKHEDLYHKQTRKFRCRYCDEKFSSEYARHTHMLDNHAAKVNVYTCELCGKSFTWRPYYMKHMKFKHDSTSRKFKCEECGKKYCQLFELKEHMLGHTGEKHFPCYICKKKYISSGSLKHHMNRHKRLGEGLGQQCDDPGESTEYAVVVKVEGSEIFAKKLSPSVGDQS